MWAEAEIQSANDTTTLAVEVDGVLVQKEAGWQEMKVVTIAPLGTCEQVLQVLVFGRFSGRCVLLRLLLLDNGNVPGWHRITCSRCLHAYLPSLLSSDGPCLNRRCGWCR